MSEDASAPQEGPQCLSEVDSEEPFIQEYLNLLEEGWRPDLEEYLARVPDDLREAVQAGIEKRLAIAEESTAEEDEAVRPQVLCVAEEAYPPRKWPEFERGVSEESESPPEEGETAQEVLSEEPELEDEQELLVELAEPEPEPVVQAADPLAALEPEDLQLADSQPAEEPRAEEPQAEEPQAEEPQAEEPQAEDLPEVPGYQLEKAVGHGPRGTVYLAHEQDSKHRVAIKVLHFAVDQTIVRDVNQVARVDHHGIVAYQELVHEDALVMEIVEGRSLRDACESLTQRDRARLLLEIARTLSAAHAEGMPHLALKPENIRVADGRGPRILDFGQPVPEQAAREGLYSSPEQIQGRAAGEASDLFSFGSVMYTILTGRTPFHRADKIVDFDPPLLREIDPEVPEELQAICLACLARNAPLRPTAEEVAFNLQNYLEGASVQIRPVRYKTALRRQVKRQQADLEEWQRAGQVQPADADRLRGIHHQLLEDEEHWRFDLLHWPRGFTALAGGAATAVASAYLAAWYGRANIAALWSWLIPAVTCLTLLGIGVALWQRRKWQLATVALAGGTLAILPAVLSALASTGTLAIPVEGTSPLLAEGTHANSQIWAASLTALCVSIGIWAATRLAAFAWTTVATGLVAYVAGLVTFGWLDMAPVMQAVCVLPLAALPALGVLWESRGRHRWATPFHVCGLAALVAAPVGIAWSGAIPSHLLPEWLDAQWLGVAVHGLILIGMSAVLAGRAGLGLRRDGTVLAWTGPVLVLGALYFNAARSGHIGAVPLLFVAALVVLAFATSRRDRWVLMEGAAGVVLACQLLFVAIT